MWELATDSKKEITGLVCIETDKLLVNWKFANEEECSQGNVNVAIASFITAYARRELWRMINLMETRSPGSVFYMDTDSIFYLANKDTELLPTGPLLGDLTREIGADEVVYKLVILGPKNYGYVKRNKTTGSEAVTIKVKGITLDAKTLETINIERMTDMCEAYMRDRVPVAKANAVKVKQPRIHSSKSQIITNVVIEKVFRAVSEKRLVVGNDTYPKGFVLSRSDIPSTC